MTSQGWECPKCGRVYAPWVADCWWCGRKTVSGTTTTTGQCLKCGTFLLKNMAHVCYSTDTITTPGHCITCGLLLYANSTHVCYPGRP